MLFVSRKSRNGAWSEDEPAEWIAAIGINHLKAYSPARRGPNPIFEFTTDAKQLWVKHHAKMKTEMIPNRDGDEARRTPYQDVIRTLACGCCMQWASSDGYDEPAEVDIASLGAAIALAEYYTTTSDKVLFTLHDSTPVDRLTGDKLTLYDALANEFTTAKAILKADEWIFKAYKSLNEWKRDWKREGKAATNC